MEKEKDIKAVRGKGAQFYAKVISMERGGESGGGEPNSSRSTRLCRKPGAWGIARCPC